MLLLLQWLALLLMWYLYCLNTIIAKVLRSQVEVWGDGRTGQYEAGKKLIPEQIYITFSRRFYPKRLTRMYTHFTFTLMAHCTSGAIRGSVSCSRTLRQGIELA